MSLFYRIAYRIGLTPWEEAAVHPAAAGHIAALFDREERERRAPYGAALDLGCGTGFWAVELARRGWEVTGVDLVATAVQRARERAQRAGAKVTLVEGDLTALRASGVEGPFGFFWDFGAIHGMDPAQRAAVGREVTALAAPEATLLLLAWAPGRRGPLPRGASRADLEEAFPKWRVVEQEPFDASGLPPFLRKVDPQVYRLRRA